MGDAAIVVLGFVCVVLFLAAVRWIPYDDDD